MRNTKLTLENRASIQQAKIAIRESAPKKALEILFSLPQAEFHKDLSLLLARLNQQEKDQLLGILAEDQRIAQHNRLLKDLLDLIDLLEEEQVENQQVFQEVIRLLQVRYQERLAQKLAGRQSIHLKYLVSNKGSSVQAGEMFVDEVAIGEAIKTDLYHTFESALGRLLIIGPPGSGKSTLLLQLALRLLSQKRATLPVVLNLATWQSKYQTLHEWLADILWLELRVSKNLAKQILESTPLVLLLDGLDEVAEAHRTTCIEAIGEYGAVAERQYVISSRIEAYQQTQGDAPVHLQIELSPLSLERITEELQQMGRKQPEVMPLLHALRQDPLLQEAVQTPFYLNTAQSLFAGGKKWQAWSFAAADLEGRKKELLDRYIQQKLHTFQTIKYAPEQTTQWLSTLASQMTKDNLAYFELTDVQPRWWMGKKWKVLLLGILFGILLGVICGWTIGVPFGLQSPRDRLAPSFPLEKIITGIKIGLVLYAPFFSLSLGLILLLFRKPPYRLMLGLLSGMMMGLALVGLTLGLALFLSFLKLGTLALIFYYFTFLVILFGFGGAVIYKIRTRKDTLVSSDRLTWSWSQFKKRWKREAWKFIPPRAKTGLWIGIFGGTILAALLVALLSTLTEEVTMLLRYGVGLALVGGGVLGLLVGLVFGTVEASLRAGIHKNYFLQINRPYQRLTSSLRHLNPVLLHHGLFRFLLYTEGALPLHLVRFLNEMSDRNLLETDGGRWRFRHQLIQEYFVDLPHS